MQTQQNTTQATLPPKLFEILEKEVALSQEMLRILEAEKDALVEMDMQTLLNLSRKKENQLSMIQALDQSLQETSQKLANRGSDEPVKLTELAALASDAEVERLMGYRERLITMREEIISRNVINKHFAEDTQHFLGDAISMITNAVAERPMYSNKGINKPSVKQPSLISREV